MSRINYPQSAETAPEASQTTLKALEAKIGFLPNLYKVTATSSVALEGLTALSAALAKGALDAKTRERIALAVANVNGCDYCNAAHTAIGRSLKLTDQDIADARAGRDADANTNAIVSLARNIAVRRGDISEADLQAARAAGVNDAQLVEIVLNVALNVATNYVNEVFKTPIDFPQTEAANRAA
jgi:uncharacterized peroxidase-related enzyme